MMAQLSGVICPCLLQKSGQQRQLRCSCIVGLVWALPQFCLLLSSLPNFTGEGRNLRAGDAYGMLMSQFYLPKPLMPFCALGVPVGALYLPLGCADDMGLPFSGNSLTFSFYFQDKGKVTSTYLYIISFNTQNHSEKQRGQGYVKESDHPRSQSTFTKSAISFTKYTKTAITALFIISVIQKQHKSTSI